jgi:Tol biopolymer transport system component
MTRLQLLPAVAITLLVSASIGVAFGAPGDTELISVNAANSKAAGNSDDFVTAISADGRLVAFASFATTLVANDADGMEDVFVRDRLTGKTERVVVGGDDFAMSANGRYIAVDAGGGIFVYDRQTDTKERVDVSSTGEVANKLSLEPAINADGRYVAFVSEATNLVPNSNQSIGVFVHDRQTGITSRVSVSSSGVQGNGPSGTRPSLSADGRYVAFGSEATNLVANDANGTAPDIFVRDRQLGQTELVSVNSAGVQGNGPSNNPAISADGSRVAFWSNATNLVPNDTNFDPDIFVHDRGTGQTERASVASDGTEANDSSNQYAISADGRYVVFESAASNLVPGDSNGLEDIFWHDTQTGKTERASVATNGAQAAGQNFAPSISADGLLVAFVSAARNLSGNDSNNTEDVYVHEPGGPSGGPETIGYTLRPRAMDFGIQPVSSSRFRNFFLTNTGNVPLSIASVELLGTDSTQFAMVSSCVSPVAVSATCRIRIYFRPTSVGHKLAQLKVIAGNKPARLRDITGTAQ